MGDVKFFNILPFWLVILESDFRALLEWRPYMSRKGPKVGLGMLDFVEDISMNVVHAGTLG